MSAAFRVTQQSISATALSGLQENLSRTQRLQEQLSSGRLINRPSDNPVGTVSSMRFRSTMGRTEQYVRNADDARAWLGTADAALTKSMEGIRRVQQLTLRGSNDTNPPEARAALGIEVDSLRKALLDVANTRYLDRPIFAGTSSSENAYDAGTGDYLGNTGTVARTVAANTRVPVNVTGTEVFGADGDPSQLFTVLDSISDHLKEADPVVRHQELDQDLARLETAMDRVLGTLSEVGARYHRVETMRTSANDQLFTLRDDLAKTESIDLPKTIMDLQLQEVAYQAALGATARAIQPSLLNFLR